MSMDRVRGSRDRRVGLGKALRGLPLAAVVAAGLAGAAFALSGGSSRPASAEILPPNCGPTIGTAAASIRIEVVPANPKDGDVLAYKVGTGYPAPTSGIACTVFDVDIFLKKPGSSAFLFVCNIASLASGSGTIECPGASNYTVSGADRTASGDLIATVHVMGNKHDRIADCVFQTSPRDATKIDPCFDASVISRLSQASTPTPTSTPTSTTVPENTQIPTDTPVPADTPIPAVTRTRSGGVLNQVTLPSTGTGDSETSPEWIIVALILAGGGIALASAGRLAYKSARW